MAYSLHIQVFNFNLNHQCHSFHWNGTDSKLWKKVILIVKKKHIPSKRKAIGIFLHIQTYSSLIARVLECDGWNTFQATCWHNMRKNFIDSNERVSESWSMLFITVIVQFISIVPLENDKPILQLHNLCFLKNDDIFIIQENLFNTNSRRKKKLLEYQTYSLYRIFKGHHPTNNSWSDVKNILKWN